MVVFSVVVCNALGFLVGMVGGGEERLYHRSRQCPGINGEGDADHDLPV